MLLESAIATVVLFIATMDTTIRKECGIPPRAKATGLPAAICMDSKDDNIYFIDSENVAEMARLTDQDHVITKHMGGHFAEIDLSHTSRVLDVACGPGGWAQEVAFAHPEMEVVGFDISEIMIKYAQAQAKVQGLDNASFYIMDMQKKLDFLNNTFDFVNARFITILPEAFWHHLMQEVGRITRPGGIIRLVETDWWATTNSRALQELSAILCRSVQGGFWTHGYTPGVLPMLGQLLKEAGCHDVQQRPYLIDYSYGTEAYEFFLQDIERLFQLAEPRMVKRGFATQEEYDKLFSQMRLDMMQQNFRGSMLIVSAWGTTD